MVSVSRIPGTLVVWVTAYIFFILSLANNLSASHDSIHYLLDIIQGKELFHQHHLLYGILASKWMLLLPGVPKPYAIESFTALWGSSVLAIVYAFFRNRFHLLPIPAAMGSAIIGFSYGVWFYSVNIEVYMPPLFFILCSLYVLTQKSISIHDIRKMAVLHSLAILFHQVNVLFVLVPVYVIITNRRNLNLASALLQYALIGIIVAGGMYFIAGWCIEGHNSFAEWMHWMEGYAVGHGYWQPLSAKTPVHVATGFSHAFVGGHFIFQIPAVQQLFEASFREHGLTDEIFLSSKISPAGAWALAACSVVTVILLTGVVFRFIRFGKSILLQSGDVVKPLLLTILIYSIFFCFWMPEVLEFWILQMVLVWLLLIGMLPLVRFPFRIQVRNGLLVLAILMFSINYFGSLRWLQDINNDWYYSETSKINAQVNKNDLVIVDNEWILKDFLRYYTTAEVLATDEPGYSKPAEETKVREVLSRKGRVFTYRDHHFTRSY